MSFARRDKLAAYAEAVRAAGLEPVPIWAEEKRGLEGLSGLVLTGGGDVDPALYGEEPNPLTNHVLRERDDLESELIGGAERAGLPILGICRGLQILNVARGGTLHQHIEGHKDCEHAVSAVPGSKAADLIGAEPYAVNSRHHQAVHALGRGLAVTARAADGTIEAAEDPSKRFVVAVQWHPEDRLETRDFRIFQAFAAAVRE